MAATVDGRDLGTEARILAFDRALHYGDGLFETIAVVAGVPLFWDAHIARLAHGAKILRLLMPDPLLWMGDFQNLLRGAAIKSHRMLLKLILSRGDGGGYGSSGAGPARRYLFLSEWPERAWQYWEPGIATALCPVPLLTGASFLTVKSLNRLNQVAARDALSPEYPEGVMLDQAGILREGVMSNLFWTHSGVVYTPDLTDGGIAGIQRRVILDGLDARGMPVRLVRCGAEVLQDAEEIFFSNSLIGIWPVRHYAQRLLPGHAGPVASALLAWHREMGLGPQR